MSHAQYSLARKFKNSGNGPQATGAATSQHFKRSSTLVHVRSLPLRPPFGPGPTSPIHRRFPSRGRPKLQPFLRRGGRAHPPARMAPPAPAPGPGAVRAGRRLPPGPAAAVRRRSPGGGGGGLPPPVRRVSRPASGPTLTPRRPTSMAGSGPPSPSPSPPSPGLRSTTPASAPAPAPAAGRACPRPSTPPRAPGTWRLPPPSSP